jgi:hypothetical protein
MATNPTDVMTNAIKVISTTMLLRTVTLVLQVAQTAMTLICVLLVQLDSTWTLTMNVSSAKLERPLIKRVKCAWMLQFQFVNQTNSITLLLKHAVIANQIVWNAHLLQNAINVKMHSMETTMEVALLDALLLAKQHG